MKKILFAFLFISTTAQALSFNGQSCDSITVTPQLVVSCNTGNATTTTVTTPAETPVVSNTPSCILSGKVVNYAVVELSVQSNIDGVNFNWSDSSCSSSYSTCSIPKFGTKVYSVTCVGSGGVKLQSNKIAL